MRPIRYTKGGVRLGEALDIARGGASVSQAATEQLELRRWVNCVPVIGPIYPPSPRLGPATTLKQHCSGVERAPAPAMVSKMDEQSITLLPGVPAADCWKPEIVEVLFQIARQVQATHHAVEANTNVARIGAKVGTSYIHVASILHPVFSAILTYKVGTHRCGQQGLKARGGRMLCGGERAPTLSMASTRLW